ncbi:MAG TPA: DUF1929 domain-containing protein [Planctomycetaceae bacterium]|nr:DUF1929 domain-containing protein [Planctomycetaceae bacterium]
MPNNEGDLFCAGSTWTPEGKLLVAGGTAIYGSGGQGWGGGELIYLFDPLLPLPQAWVLQDERMLRPRWYPTLTMLGDAQDRVLSFGGLSLGLTDVKNTYEEYTVKIDASTGLAQSDSVSVSPVLYDGPDPPPGSFGNDHWLGLYPRTNLLSNGEVFLSGYTQDSASLEHVTGVSDSDWNHDDTAEVRRHGGGSVLFPNFAGYEDVIMAIGGRNNAGTTNVVTDSVQWARISGASPSAWIWNDSWPDLGQARWRANTTLLPDGSVLVVGGNTVPGNETTEVPTTTSERFYLDAQGVGHWQSNLPAPNGPRTYHSAAVLLPSGKVFIAGGNSRDWDYQVYVPGYLTSGLEQPVLTNVPGVINYGANQVVQISHLDMASTDVERIVLMRPASVTHHNDYDQRYVELDVLSATDTSITVAAPLDANHAPRGYYMVFAVSAQGTPSEAGWTLLR